MKLNEKNANYAVIKTAFHGGGVVSYHKSLTAAEKACKKFRGNNCICGCCAVVTIDKLQEIPEYTGNEFSPYTLCK